LTIGEARCRLDPANYVLMNDPPSGSLGGGLSSREPDQFDHRMNASSGLFPMSPLDPSPNPPEIGDPTDAGLRIASRTSSDRASLIVALAGWYALSGGCMTLAGWFFDSPRLTDWSNDGISMFVNTAICAILGGAGLLALGSDRTRWLAWLLGSGMSLIGGLTVFEHLSGINLGIDTLLLNRPWGQAAAAAPMRMGPPASVSFTIIGIALLLVSSKKPSLFAPASTMGMVVSAIALLSLIGYLYGATHLYTIPKLTAIAIQTATIVFALGLGLIAAVPTRGVAGMLQRDDAGGVLMRRLLLPIVVIPILAGALRVAGEKAGFYDTTFGTAMLVLLMIGCFFSLLRWTASGLSRTDQIRRQQESALLDSERAQRLLLESERAARMEVERTARAKDDFLATVSHELRSPLNSISGWAQVLRRGKEDVALIADATTAIEAAVRSQVRIIDDLLDVNRIAAGKLRLDMGDVDLVAVIRAAIDGVRASAEAKALQLEVNLNPEARRIKGDAGRLQQLVSNLLSNAVKFTPNAGRIDVTLSRVGSDVEICVSDNGQGIRPEFLSRAFERFTQADDSITRRHGGLGLGLAIVKNITELHGGSVSVESPGENRGTTFRVRLPVMVVDSACLSRTPGPAAQELDLTGVRILAADDDRSTAELLARLLGAAGAVLRLTGSGGDTLAMAREFEPHILCCDISMPDLDGYEVIRRLRDAGIQTPAVAVTAFARAEDKARALQAGFNAHLSKPVDAHELMTVVKALIELRRSPGGASPNAVPT
jgi:signal transduction histidine kinase/ActR/RegA family two-component response regulator